MPLSTDVNLPRNFPARYPSRCVRCNGDNQGQTIRIWTHSIGWWTFLFWWFGWGVSTRPPACTPCGWWIRLERLGGMALTIVITIVFLSLVWPYFDDLVSRTFWKWVAMGLVLLCLSPYFLWATFFPPAIDFTAYSSSIDYEFKNADYAYEFAELNEDAEWVKVS